MYTYIKLLIFVLLTAISPSTLLSHQDHHHSTNHDSHGIFPDDPWIHHHDHKIHRFYIHKVSHEFSTEFDLHSHDYGHLGRVVQSNFSLRKNYSFYNVENKLTLSAYARVFFSSFKNSATVMDVYDHSEKGIGQIWGTMFFTTAPAKFYFYNEVGDTVGIAYLDKDRCTYRVYDATDSALIAVYRRHFVRGDVDHWEVDIIDSDAIDARLHIAFASFAIDTQGDFRQDN